MFNITPTTTAVLESKPSLNKENVMLTWYYDTHRTPVFDLLDAFKGFEDFDKRSTKKSRETVDDEGLKIEMPGVKSGDLDVTVENRTLRVKGKSRTGKEFSYTYSLHSSVDTEAVTAKLEDGLLEIFLPKRPESTPRKITIS